MQYVMFATATFLYYYLIYSKIIVSGFSHGHQEARGYPYYLCKKQPCQFNPDNCILFALSQYDQFPKVSLQSNFQIGSDVDLNIYNDVSVSEITPEFAKYANGMILYRMEFPLWGLMEGSYVLEIDDRLHVPMICNFKRLSIFGPKVKQCRVQSWIAISRNSERFVM